MAGHENTEVKHILILSSPSSLAFPPTPVVFFNEFLSMKKMLFFSDFKKASRIKPQSVRAV